MREGGAGSPFTLNVLLNNKLVAVEFDTGAASTTMSKSTYENFWPVLDERPKLRESSVVLRVYGGAALSIAGEISVSAQIPGSSFGYGTVIVIENGEVPCLFGRDLVTNRKLGKINLSQIHKITFACSDVFKDFSCFVFRRVKLFEKQVCEI